VRPGLIAGAIGQGLSSFTDSYLKAKAMKEDQVDREEQRAIAREKLKLEEKNSGAGLLKDALGGLPEEERGSGYGQSLQRRQAEILGVPYVEGGPKGKPEWQKKMDYQDGLIRGRNPVGGAGKQLSASDALKLAEGESMPSVMEDLATDIDTNKNVMGPVEGRKGALNPYNTQAQTFNAKMTATAQKIGKYMEGGVLRAEDVPKYRAMLPNITDTPEVAEAKRQQVQKMLADQQGLNVKSLRDSRYDTSAFDKKLAPEDPDDAAAIAWAKKNPKDPRARQIRAIHGF